MIEKVVEIHYGIRSGLIGESLMESVTFVIAQRFKTLTVQDIGYAFERAKIPRDENWRNVTKAMIIEPIEKWWNKREGIGLDYESHKRQAAEKTEGELKAKEFKSKCIVIYAHSLKEKEWKGTIFQAAIVAPLLKDHIDQSDKDELWSRACNDYREINKEAENVKHFGGKIHIENSSRTANRLYCERIVKLGIALNIPL